MEHDAQSNEFKKQSSHGNLNRVHVERPKPTLP